MKHCIIPDTQVKPGNNLDFLEAVGNYLVAKQPEVVVQIGDFADMPSLCSYDVGTKSFEGRRYKEDILAAQMGMQRLLAPIQAYNKKAKRTKHKQYLPRMVLTLGNHEQRITKAVNNDAKLDGTIGLEDLKYAEAGWEVYPFLQPVVIDGIAYCFAFDERVLCSDFTYKPVQCVTQGDKLLGFDEHGNAKKYKEAVVESVAFDYTQTYQVNDSSGQATTVTGDHLWLVRPCGTQYEWVPTNKLKPGYEILQPFQQWKRSTDVDMAWLGGVIDGEGWLSKPNAKQGGIQVGIAQNDGVVFDKICHVLSVNGFKFSVSKLVKCNKLQILGSLNDKLRLLVETNSIRLLNKLKPEMLGRLQSTGINPTITSIIPVGEKKIVKIKTTTGTLIVNGQAHHNCHYFTTGLLGRPCSSATVQLAKKHQSCISGHQQGLQIATGHRADGTRLTSVIAGSCYEHEEDYLGPQGNKHWQGILMLHEVHQGEFDLMPISLKFLKTKYL